MSEGENKFSGVTPDSDHAALVERLGVEMAGFVEEVKAMRDREIEQYEKKDQDSAGVQKGSGHFLDPDFNPEHLTLIDKRAWDMVKDGSMMDSDYQKYRDYFMGLKASKMPKDHYLSCDKFFQFIGNKYGVLSGERQMVEIRKKRHQGDREAPKPEIPPDDFM